MKTLKMSDAEYTPAEFISFVRKEYADRTGFAESAEPICIASVAVGFPVTVLAEVSSAIPPSGEGEIGFVVGLLVAALSPATAGWLLEEVADRRRGLHADLREIAEFGMLVAQELRDESLAAR